MTANPDNPHNDYAQPGTRRLAGNTFWNLAGMCLPMAVALFAIPLLISGLGNARFGLLGLVWMLVGYFSIFDLGLGRALTKMASAQLGQGRTDDVPGLFWTAMLLMLGLGGLLALGIAGAAPALANHLLKVPDELRAEALRAFHIVAIGMPIVITTTGLVGMLEAYQFFRQINFVRFPAGSFTFLGPLCVLPFTNTLPAIVAVLIVGRLVETIAYFLVCLYKIPALRARPGLRRALIQPMAKFGGWLTVSNLAMPLMAHIDRFFVGALVSVTAVAYYVTPAEIVIKLLIIPRAWVSVLFPAFSAGAARTASATRTASTARTEETDVSAHLFSRGLRYLPGALFPAALAIITLAPEGLRLWLGLEYAAHSTVVMRWLAAGIFLNGLAYVPFSYLQGLGRPDLAARLHLVELIIYLAAAPFIIRQFGIAGAALAWCIRAGLDLLALLWMTGRLAPGAHPAIRRLLCAVLLCLNLLAGVALPWAFLPRCAIAAAAAVIFAWFYWRHMLEPDERQTALRHITKNMQRLGKL